MDKTEIILNDELREILKAVENVPIFWAVHPLEDLPELPQFNRRLVITGFNCPDLSDSNNVTTEERVEITIKQIFEHKESGKMFMSIKQPVWLINADTWSFLRLGETPVEVAKNYLDADGKILKTDKVNIRVGSVKYTRFLIFNKKAHLVDLFKIYLADYAKMNIAELNKI